MFLWVWMQSQEHCNLPRQGGEIIVSLRVTLFFFGRNGDSVAFAILHVRLGLVPLNLHFAERFEELLILGKLGFSVATAP